MIVTHFIKGMDKNVKFKSHSRINFCLLMNDDQLNIETLSWHLPHPENVMKIGFLTMDQLEI